MNRHPARVVIAVLALTLLAACSSDSATEDKPAGPPKPSSTQGSTAEASKNGANEIGIDQPDPAKTIFSKQFTLPGSDQRKVTVGILSLERKDRVAILKLVLTPDFPDLPPDKPIGFQEAIDESIGFAWQPTLLDLKNLKRYNVLHQPGTAGQGMLLFADGQAVSGKPIYGWAVFAPPPTAVTSLDVTITDWMPRFTNVPIR